MRNLVARLRDPSNSGEGCKQLVLDAADEIERLLDWREEAARIVERRMGPIEIYNHRYREWMECAQEIRALSSQPPGPKPPPRGSREVG
jgi:hypothetical protein